MVISQAQFCVNLLTEYFNPGGPINTKSQLTDDIRRPLLSATIIEGFKRNSIDNVEVELSGILDQKGDNLFSAECFTFNCFDESGLETSIEGVSDICIVDTGEETRYMDKNEREQKGFSCFINSFGKSQYFIRGTVDKEGALYLADFGIVNPIFGNRVIIENNVPFFFKKKIGSIFARTIKPIPAGIRVVTIKKVTDFGVEVIGTVYGQLEEEFYFPHNILQPGRSFTFNDQKLNLENLCINLLLFTNFKRFQAKSNQFIYRNINYSSPQIENIINNSASTLVNLINTGNTEQTGSIPKDISTYINNQNQYNSEADRFYLQEILSCFESNCFDSFCFQNIINRSLINRSISNRALAWVVLFLVSYNINYSQDVSDSINLILDYILRQRDFDTRLFYDGWNQIEEECTEITFEDEEELLLENNDALCLESEVDEIANTYTTSLEKDTNISTSTNIAIFMALLKGFELTQNFRYLSLACDLHTSIEKYLLSNNGLYNHSLTIKQPTIESVTYQLQIIQILQDFKNITTVVNFFKSRLIAIPSNQIETILVNTDEVLIGSEAVTIEVIPTNADKDNSLFTPTIYDSINSLDDIFKYNYLAYSSLINLNQNILIDFLPTIDDKYSVIENNIINNRIDSALVFSIGCIINNQSYLNFDNSRFNILIDFYNLKFQREATFNILLNTLPINFGWFNENTLNRRSHIGSILYAKASELAVINTKYEYLLRISSLDNLYGILLNNRADDFGLVRFDKETDSSLINRIKTELYKRASNVVAIEEKLNQLNTEGLINDNYLASAATEDFEDSLFSTNWGEGYIAGPNLINTNIFTIQLNQPLEVDVRQEIERIKPAGIKLKVYETFTFRIGSSIGNSTAINIIDVAGGCDGIDTEDNNDYVTEVGDVICLEDSESIISPLIPSQPILPPLDNDLEIETTCDCISLRGYISINGIPTEVRNMRNITINTPNDGYDINITNENIEPCNLAIQNVTNNFNLPKLEININPLPTEIAEALAPDFSTLYRVDKMIVNSINSDELFTFTFKSDIQGGRRVLYKEQNGIIIQEATIPYFGSFFDVEQTDNYLLLVGELSIIAIDKVTLVRTDITITLPSQTTNLRLLLNNNESIFIYTQDSTDNLIHHFIWNENSPTIITNIGSLGTSNPETTSIYFRTSSNIQRLDQHSTGMELLNISNFGITSTLIHNLSILPSGIARYVKHLDGLNYFITVDNTLPFNSVNVYQQYNSTIQFLYNDISLSELTYAVDFFNTRFSLTGQLYKVGNYITMTGSNKAYNLSTQTLENINSFICINDVITLPPSSTIQSIQPYKDELIVTVVDLIASFWDRFTISQVPKVC